MQPRYLLDTNICIYIAKQKPLSVMRKFTSMSVGSLAMSVITRGELRFGAQKSHSPQKALAILQELEKYIPCLTMPREVANCYGEIRQKLEKTGKPIGNNDLWIAAHALADDLTLITNNVTEFARIPDLRIENWVT